ncbi:MAG: VanW family protein, partial [Microgenomates group bacterium GW2011_GWA2_47_8]
AAVDRQAVSSAIDEYAATHDIDPTGARLRIDNGNVTTIAAGSPGKVTDRAAALDLIASELDARAVGTAAKARISLPAKAITSDISAATVSKLGIKELIGKATTDFSGSPKNRQHNIATGISFLTGIVVKPGEEFSTNAAIGQVDGSTGYLPELVIKENKTTPEFGGGLCQVSTTLFRSVMNAGLPVTERQNHSYRVTYYERGVGPGLDATIYAPHPDFRFKNDTPGAVLVQGYVEGTKATFEIYGTKDSRSSQIIGPTTLATYPPPDPIKTETNTLARGVEKQTETAHPGAKTTATYVVTRDGKEINRQVFNSYYKPWPAQFLVGTNDSLAGAVAPPAQ